MVDVKKLALADLNDLAPGDVVYRVQGEETRQVLSTTKDFITLSAPREEGRPYFRKDRLALAIRSSLFYGYEFYLISKSKPDFFKPSYRN